MVKKSRNAQSSLWYDGFVRLFVWYPRELPNEERKLLLKLDAAVLLYVCASFLTKSLDKYSITNSYVTNMKEELNFSGNDLAYAKSLHSAGYIISMCCGVLLATRPWARLVLPSLELVWGALTFCESAATKPEHIFALRFLIGLAEGPLYPSVVYALGSWYRPCELFRRVMAFCIASSLGGILAGVLQTAAFNRLDGVRALSGWRWSFIINGIITVPIAMMGMFVYPGAREQSSNYWGLSAMEKELAAERMRQSGVKPSTRLSKTIVKRIFLRWHVYYYTVFWVLLNVVALPEGLGFQLWLKSKPQTFSISQINNFPSIQGAVGIVAQFLLAGLADTFPAEIFLTIVQALFIVSFTSLAIWTIPDVYRWICFMIVPLVGVNQAIVSGQISLSCRRDAEERAFVLGFSNAFSQAMNIWTNIVLFPTNAAPEFRTGYIVSASAAGAMLILPILSIYGNRFDKKQDSQQEDLSLQDAQLTLSLSRSDSEEQKPTVCSRVHEIENDDVGGCKH